MKNKLNITTFFFVVLFFFFGSVETQAQYNFSKKSHAEAWFFTGAFKSDIVQGRFIGGIFSLFQAPNLSKKRSETLLGFQVSGAQYSFKGNENVWEGDGQGNYATIGLALERRNSSKDRNSILRFSAGGKVLNLKEGHSGFSSISQHTLLYGEVWLMNFRSKQAFSRFDLSLRYEGQVMSSGSTNHPNQGSQLHKQDRGSLSARVEVSLISFPLEKDWGVVLSVGGVYDHQNYINGDFYTPSGILSLYSPQSDILRLEGGRKFFPQNEEYSNYINVSTDVLNIIREVGGW